MAHYSFPPQFEVADCDLKISNSVMVSSNMKSSGNFPIFYFFALCPAPFTLRPTLFISAFPPGPLPARRVLNHGLTGRRVGPYGPYGFRLGDRASSSERPEAAFRTPHSPFRIPTSKFKPSPAYHLPTFCPLSSAPCHLLSAFCPLSSALCPLSSTHRQRPRHPLPKDIRIIHLFGLHRHHNEVTRGDGLGRVR